jgi:hypothetical protein
MRCAQLVFISAPTDLLASQAERYSLKEQCELLGLILINSVSTLLKYTSNYFIDPLHYHESSMA